MTNKQPDMRKRSEEIASLEGDDVAEILDDKPDYSIKDVDDLAIDDTNHDAIYAEILEQLKRGVPQKQVEDRLVSKGVSRMQAREITQQVWAENSHERKANAYILYAAATVCLLIGVGLLFLNLRAGSIPILSPAWLMVGVGVYLAYKGYQDYKAA